MRVLTPQFYTDIVLASSPASYIANYAQLPLVQRTFYVSHGVETVQDALSRPCSDDRCSLYLGKLRRGERLRWSFLRLLRRGQGHPLDGFVSTHLHSDLATAYRGTVGAILASQYLCFGIVEILDALRWVGFIVLAWIGTGRLLDIVAVTYT